MSITIGQIDSQTRNTQSHRKDAAHFREFAHLVSLWERNYFPDTVSESYQLACRQSAQAAILEELCSGVSPAKVVAERIDNRDLWQFSRLAAVQALGVEPQGKQQRVDCPVCECSVSMGERCGKCGAEIW